MVLIEVCAKDVELTAGAKIYSLSLKQHIESINNVDNQLDATITVY